MESRDCSQARPQPWGPRCLHHAGSHPEAGAVLGRCAWPLFSPRSPLSPSPHCPGSLEARRLPELEVEPSRSLSPERKFGSSCRSGVAEGAPPAVCRAARGKSGSLNQRAGRAWPAECGCVAATCLSVQLRATARSSGVALSAREDAPANGLLRSLPS